MANEAPTQDAGAGILAAAKSARALAKRSLELTSADTMALCAEPVLEALGWDIRNPSHVRRRDGETLRLMEHGKPVMSLHAMAMNSDLPESITPHEEEIDWMAVTNGVDWAIFSQRNPSKVLRKVSLETVATAKEGLDTMLMLQQGSIRKGALSETFTPAVLDDSVAKSLARHLEGSDALISAILQDLESEGIRADASEVRAALGRQAGSQEVTPAEEPAAEEKPKKAAPARKPRAKKAAATKGRAKKPAAKPAAKKTAASKTAAKKATTSPTAAQSDEKAEAAPKAEAAREDKTTASEPVKEEDIQAGDDKAPVETAAKDEPNPTPIDWPEKASHVMQRKQVVAYIDYDKKTGKSTLLPGSVLNGKVGKSLNPAMIRAREQSLEDGSLKEQGEMAVLTTPMEFENPRLAATFAAATLVKDMSAWKTRKGEPLAEPSTPAAKKADATASESAAPAPAQDAQVEETAVAG